MRCEQPECDCCKEASALMARIAELEDDMRSIEAELIGAHDGGCILPIRQIVNRALRKGAS